MATLKELCCVLLLLLQSAGALNIFDFYRTLAEAPPKLRNDESWATGHGEESDKQLLLENLFELGVKDFQMKSLSENRSKQLIDEETPASSGKLESSLHEEWKEHQYAEEVDDGNSYAMNKNSSSDRSAVLKSSESVTNGPGVSSNFSGYVFPQEKVEVEKLGHPFSTEFLPPMGGLIELFQNGGWTMIKSKIIETINLITNNNEELDDILPLNTIKNFLDMGDKVYLIQTLSSKLKPEFSEFLADQLSPVISKLDIFRQVIPFEGNATSHWVELLGVFGSKGADMLISKARKMIKAYLSQKELLEYMQFLEKSNPTAASGLDFILDLSGNSSDAGSGRSIYRGKNYETFDGEYSGVDRHDYGSYGSHDSGYGHSSHGGYGHQPSYGQVDPYLLLAGLGAATLLAYIAYRVLVTTAATAPRGGRRRKRDMLGTMDLSDVPDFVYTVYNMIETADAKYGDANDDIDDFTHNLNALWAERESGSGCVRCVLFKRVSDRLHVDDHQYLEHVITAGVAHMLGAAGAGQLLDEFRTISDSGHRPQCQREEQGTSCRVVAAPHQPQSRQQESSN